MSGSARAQGAFYEVGLARAAVAAWERPGTQTFGFVLAAEGIYSNLEAGGHFLGDFACAGFGNEKRGVFGCGEISEFSIDNDLGTARARGSINVMLYEAESERPKPGGKISFAMTWRASGNPAPGAHGHIDVEPGFAGFFVEPAVQRDASAGGKPRSSKFGAFPTKLVEAVTFAGGVAGVGAYG